MKPRPAAELLVAPGSDDGGEGAQESVLGLPQAHSRANGAKKPGSRCDLNRRCIFAGATIEFGAAWKKRSREGRDYLSVKLDDPSFPAPIYASLVETETQGEFALIWSRRTAD